MAQGTRQKALVVLGIAALASSGPRRRRPPSSHLASRRHAQLMRAPRATSTWTTMRKMCARPARAICTTGTIAAGKKDGRGGGGSSSRWLSSIASTHAAVPLVRFPSLEASWEAKRRKRKSRKPAVILTPSLLGPPTSMLYILLSIEAADSPAAVAAEIGELFWILQSFIVSLCCCSSGCRCRCLFVVVAVFLVAVVLVVFVAVV